MDRMDGAQFAKMLSDKHLFELNRMEYKYSTVSVKEFAELLRQNFAQPLPLTDFSGNKLFYLPNLAQISTNGILPPPILTGMDALHGYFTSGILFGRAILRHCSRRFPDTSLKTRTHITKPTNAWREML